MNLKKSLPMLKGITTLLVISSLFVSCKKNTSKEGNESYIASSNELVLEQSCDSLKKGNKLVECRTWTDKNGKNSIVFSKNIEKSIRVDFFAELFKDNRNKPYVSVYDFIDDCPVDFDVNYINNSLSITDINSNGVKEITFLYELACQGGIGPTNMKLMMIEGSLKYKIRGLRIDEVSRRNPELAVKYDESLIDNSFNSAPKEFLSFAQKEWLKYHGTQLKKNDNKLSIDKVNLLGEGEVNAVLSNGKTIEFEDPSVFDSSSKFTIKDDGMLIAASGDSYGNYVTSFLKFNSNENEFVVIKVVANFPLKQKEKDNLKICTIDNLNIPINEFDTEEIYEQLTESDNCVFKTN